MTRRPRPASERSTAGRQMVTVDRLFVLEDPRQISSTGTTIG